MLQQWTCPALPYAARSLVSRRNLRLHLLMSKNLAFQAQDFHNFSREMLLNYIEKISKPPGPACQLEVGVKNSLPRWTCHFPFYLLLSVIYHLSCLICPFLFHWARCPICRMEKSARGHQAMCRLRTLFLKKYSMKILNKIFLENFEKVFSANFE